MKHPDGGDERYVQTGPHTVWRVTPETEHLFPRPPRWPGIVFRVVVSLLLAAGCLPLPWYYWPLVPMLIYLAVWK